MLVVDKPSWVRILFSWRGTALKRVWRRVLFTTLLAVGVTVLDLEYLHFHEDLKLSQPFSLIGVALGIFLGFRNNTSYDRFWEGRKLWGSMVNVSRSFTRQVLTLVGPLPDERPRDLRLLHRGAYFGESPGEASVAANADHEELVAFQREMVRRTAGYVHAFRLHLRDDRDVGPLKGLLPEDEIEALATESNRPVAILQTLGDRLREAYLRGWIHPQHLPVLEASLTEMTGIQGGCERIKSTPIPYSYTALIHRIVAMYCFTVPAGLVGDCREFTPLAVAIIAFAFFGLDAVGDEIEDPFGTEDNDLPLAALSTMIEVNIRQRVGDEGIPELLEPVERVLR